MPKNRLTLPHLCFPDVSCEARLYRKRTNSRRGLNMRIKTRWIPKDSIPIEHPDGLGIAYVYRTPRGYAAVAYGGKRTSSDFHYSYKTIEAAHDAIEQWFTRLADHVERVKNYRKASYAPHIFKPGDIVTNSWGYDQTNVDWYRVASVT